MDDRNNELTRPMRRVEVRLGRPLSEELDDRYIRKGQTLAQVAEGLGVSTSTASRWLARFGIEARFPGQRAKVD